jgi:hypothetical protein
MSPPADFAFASNSRNSAGQLFSARLIASSLKGMCSAYVAKQRVGKIRSRFCCLDLRRRSADRDRAPISIPIAKPAGFCFSTDKNERRGFFHALSLDFDIILVFGAACHVVEVVCIFRIKIRFPVLIFLNWIDARSTSCARAKTLVRHHSHRQRIQVRCSHLPVLV